MKRHWISRTVGLGAVAALASAPAWAARDEVGGSLRMLKSDGSELGMSPLKRTDITADVAGTVARVSVKQQFHNPSAVPIEAVYTFPLPHDAAVDAMRMSIGSRRIVGQIKRKAEARQIYNQARSEGRRAGLLDQERPNIFTQSVANILPGEAITVEISYVQLLAYQGGAYEMAIPTVVGPRYTSSGGYAAPGQRGAPSSQSGPPSPGTSWERDADRVTPPIAHSGARAGHDLTLSINLNAGVPLGAVRSMLHRVNVQKQSPARARITLANGAELPNRDFILRFQTAGQAMQTGALAYAAPDGGGWFTLALQPPVAPPPAEVAPKEMVFVIDQTGSQSGWPLARAKQLMRYCLRRLDPRDTFQLLGFNTEVYPCFPAPVPATKANIEKALKYLEPPEAADGTDIMKAVSYALKIPTDPTRPRIVCYMTDGYVGNDMQVVDFLQRNRGAARMYPFGIGNSVNRFLIDAMAREGRGQAEYVTVDTSGHDSQKRFEAEIDNPATEFRRVKLERERVAAREAEVENSMAVASRFYRRIAQPVLLDVTIDWGGLEVEQVYPGVIRDVFASQPLVLRGRYKRGGTGDVTIRGLLGGRPWQQTVRVTLPKKNDGEVAHNSSLPSLWARARIEALQNTDWQGAQNGGGNADVREAIVQTALDYRLMSQWTSFVAVEDTVANPDGDPQRADVQIEMPDGVAHEGIFGGEAPASTSAASSARYRVAPQSRFSSRAGDPLISIEAPSDSKSIVAILPGGEIKRLQWNAKSALWEARFDIPIYAAAGNYQIRILMVLPNGRRKSLSLHYRVDNQAPNGKGTLDRRGNGLRLEMAGGDDTDRIEAILPWGERVDLAAKGRVFATEVAVPSAWAGKAGSVTYILTDRAHNRTRVTVDMAK